MKAILSKKWMSLLNNFKPGHLGQKHQVFDNINNALHVCANVPESATQDDIFFCYMFNSLFGLQKNSQYCLPEKEGKL